MHLVSVHMPFKPFHSSSVPCATTDSDRVCARSWNENSMGTFSAFTLPTDFRKQKPPIAQNNMSVPKVQHEEINQRAAEHSLCAEPERHANTSNPNISNSQDHRVQSSFSIAFPFLGSVPKSFFFWCSTDTYGVWGFTRRCGERGHREEMHLRTGWLAALVWNSSLR